MHRWDVSTVTARSEYGSLFLSTLETMDKCVITLLSPLNLADPSPRSVGLCAQRRSYAILSGEVTAADDSSVTLSCGGLVQRFPPFSCCIGDVFFVEANFGPA